MGARWQSKSLEEQWGNVQSWYEYLERERDSDRPSVNSLNEAWGRISDITGLHGPVTRGRACAAAESPLASLFFYVEMGVYPPPELLLALSDAWSTYIFGNVTLERAFLGAPVPKAGNYAKRHAKRVKLLSMRFEMTKLVRHGMTRMQAAEQIAAQFPGTPDPASIARTVRPFPIRRSEK